MTSTKLVNGMIPNTYACLSLKVVTVGCDEKSVVMELIEWLDGSLICKLAPHPTTTTTGLRFERMAPPPHMRHAHVHVRLYVSALLAHQARALCNSMAHCSAASATSGGSARSAMRASGSVDRRSNARRAASGSGGGSLFKARG